ncbi:MAG TPA: hypothetical protein ENO21_00165, partial [Firmicutes bacterium]|nr:hypothetical protein [Bacillota bacterium]
MDTQAKVSVEERREQGKRRRRIAVSIGLWALAVVLTLASAVYQRRTGPTYPKRVEYAAGGEVYRSELVRSGTTGEDAAVSLPDVDGMAGFLYYKRYKVDEDYSAAQMYRSEGRLTGYLPTQPMAGKLEYYVELRPEQGPGDPVRVPSDRSVVIRFKGSVPPHALIPHVIIIFISMLFGMRALLEAIRGGPGLRWLAWATTITLLVGGMYYGPMVQAYSFGAWWTGVPFGWDLTDNKTLIATIFWLIALW